MHVVKQGSHLIEGLHRLLVDRVGLGILHQANLNHKRFQFIQGSQYLGDGVVPVKVLGGVLQKSVAHLCRPDYRYLSCLAE